MNIVILDSNPLPEDMFSAFSSLGALTIYGHTNKEALIERAKDAEIVLTNKTVLSSEIIKALPKLKYIGMLSTGFDVVDIQAAANAGVLVCNVPDYSSKAVAQHIFALILALYRRVEYHANTVQAGCWVGSVDSFYWHTPQLSLNEQTIGLVGFGNIGQKVAKIANGFEMNILAYSPRTRLETEYENFAYVELEELFAQSDIISLSCPLREDNKGFVNEKLISLMKPTAIIINTARGGLINEADLAAALRDGRIAGAGLDVLSVEPPTLNNPMLGAPNCIITPHVAWAGDKALAKLVKIALKNVQAWLDNNPKNVVNKHLLK